MSSARCPAGVSGSQIPLTDPSRTGFSSAEASENPQLYDKSRVRPYGLRHAYAQRHAEGGTPVDVLRELMDHRGVETTIGYYQVSQKRKRKRFDCSLPEPSTGTADPPGSLTDWCTRWHRWPCRSATARNRATSKPVASSARSQCAGCGFYRPDPSFLPAIEEHVVELAADREMATTTDAAGWVVSNINDQLAAFTTIRDRLHEDLATMPAETRDAVEDAGRGLRKARAAAFIPVDQVRSRPNGR